MYSMGGGWRAEHRCAMCGRRYLPVRAGGAILSSLAGEIYPDAYEDAGPSITLATAAGFLVTFLL